VTDTSGRYYFMGLRAGTYSLTESAPVGYTDSVNLVGTVNGVTDGVSKNSATNDQIVSIVLALSSTGINYDFAELKS
jgi:hypothetical protein